MYVTVDVDVDLSDFETEDLIEYLEDMGYSVTKTDKYVSPEGVVEIDGTDLFRLKHLNTDDARDFILDVVLKQLSLDHLRK